MRFIKIQFAKIINGNEISSCDDFHSWKRNCGKLYLAIPIPRRIFHLSKLPPNRTGECWISRAYIIDRSLFHVSSSARDIPVCLRRPCAHTIRAAIISFALGDISTLIIVIRVSNSYRLDSKISRTKNLPPATRPPFFTNISKYVIQNYKNIILFWGSSWKENFSRTLLNLLTWSN